MPLGLGCSIMHYLGLTADKERGSNLNIIRSDDVIGKIVNHSIVTAARGKVKETVIAEIARRVMVDKVKYGVHIICAKKAEAKDIGKGLTAMHIRSDVVTGDEC